MGQSATFGPRGFLLARASYFGARSTSISGSKRSAFNCAITSASTTFFGNRTFPHITSTYPKSWNAVEHSLARCFSRRSRKVLSRNAARLYRIDLARLRNGTDSSNMEFKHGLISADDHVQEHPEVWTRACREQSGATGFPMWSACADGSDRWIVDGQRTVLALASR